jgi:hypothetical protein
VRVRFSLKRSAMASLELKLKYLLKMPMRCSRAV